jgi:hypothetical protein
MRKSLVNAALVVQQNETAGLPLFSCLYNAARFRIRISQSHHVVALGLDQYEAAGQDFRGFGDAVHRKNLEGLGTNNSAIS